MSFESLGLRADILRAIADEGYSAPTPIQQQAIPAVINGGDILAAAQTGTGKTAGFTLPLLEKLSQRDPGKTPQGRRPVRALILTPTRELAAQVHDSVRTYGKYLRLRSAVVFGGVSINPQMMTLRGGVDILVATPGRLLDLVNQNAVYLQDVEILVLDEADRMLDMGFIHDIKKVLALLPKQRQNLLFSATFSDDIKALADKLLNQPTLIEVARRNTASERVSQRVLPVDRHRKRELLSHLISGGNWQQVLVFTRTKHGANKLTEQLQDDGISAAAIHGNKSQGARTKALEDFKTGRIRALIATDIAARGIDIDQLPYVVNYELPNVPEDYVHRIGRTGRAQAEGEAVSLVCVDEHSFLRDIEKLIKREIPREMISGFEPDPSIKAEPIVLGRRMTIGVGAGKNGKQQNRGNPNKPTKPQLALGTKPKNGSNKQGNKAKSGNSGQKPAQQARSSQPGKPNHKRPTPSANPKVAV
ncbi:ATP-dependent RNA helicase RhlE [Cellvibrio japonicus]|uniref:ATP-dependent RNA helicase RhlE n=1 Tax=Cellvibrio japonicus (strain Ueda107) TaxID=498211 RepID=B3PEY0_CELJU|nr:ATP-dependent RNA helicase RhlE [Cellvibrio japonicus]ACE86307.1 Superfamily II DNA and RNA helicase [Cellvibrio japonicus Ueda107]QEI12227.1 ATP-dependent RNA helicase RhlE [Cellvibrio japonicus]QEI15801.1 ATP-dependent RNA helicase RhlE [Cellvibrio japonicus]QEI19379.1 ATP-dependent RNA helicase RhlE [Cellvibrio japonicus]